MEFSTYGLVLAAGYFARDAVAYLTYVILEKDGPFGLLVHVRRLAEYVPLVQEKERLLSTVFVICLLTVGVHNPIAYWAMVIFGLSRLANKGEIF